MTLQERVTQAEALHQQLAQTQQRAVNAAHEAASRLLLIEGQLALLRELIAEQEKQEPWPPSGA